MDEITQLITDHDSYTVAELIQREGTPEEIAKRFAQHGRDLYWKQKNLPACVILFRQGILFALTQAAGLNEHHEDRAHDLRGAAKAMAYDLGSFCWPGWDEPGIPISPAELAAGDDGARANLRLARELRRGPQPVARAHWLVGAYHLAQRRYSSALEEFGAAAGWSKESSNPVEELLARGYRTLVRLLETGSDSEEFNGFCSQLRESNSKEGPGLAEQLETARRVFSSSAQSWL